MKSYIFPKKILKNKDIVNKENLLIKKELQIGVTEKVITTFMNNSFVVLDFGVEIRGAIRILTFKGKDVKIRIRFGESLSESCAELGGEKNATNDHSLRDITTSLQDYSDMTYGCTGFRFVRIDFYGDAEIKCIVAESEILSKKTIYSYNGNDSKIKEIFNVAKRTIDLCSAGDYLWDGIKRDRLIWIGDIHPEMLALTTLYGRSKIIERSLDFVKNQTPLPNWMNWVPMYSMWWIIIVADYLECTKAEGFAKKQIYYLKQLVRLMLDYVTFDGETTYGYNFIDWQTQNEPDKLAGVRAINIIAAKKAIFLLEYFNEKTDDAKELLTRLMKKKIEVESSKSVLGLKYFAVGLEECDKEKLVKNGVNGFSTFMSYYVLNAIASFDKEKAVEMMKEYYGAMLNKGATTFWEDFNILWTENSCRIDELPKENQKDIHGDFGAHCYIGFRHSLCHGWSAGIIKFIKECC